jgi:flagellar biosynthesis anti-sigma factor FlgM
MNISTDNKLAITPITRSAADVAPRKDNEPIAQPSSQAKSTLTDVSGALLDRAFNSVREHSGIDNNKVSAIKQAIKNGQFEMDDVKLANLIRELHRN